ncbi:MAG TPA: hypothetical protein VHG08_28155 [Longimicrobium sp.]|nr:hypothetical protein [Longimicrobium sp.]
MATRPPQGEEEARAALTVLAGFFPESERARFLSRFLDAMEQEFRDSGVEPPAWLQTLRDEMRRDPS